MKKAAGTPHLPFPNCIALVLAIVTPDSQNTLINGIDSQSVAQILTAQKKGTLFDRVAWQLCQEKNKAFGQAQAAWQANVASFGVCCNLKIYQAMK